LFGETGTADGDDGVHGLFKRDWSEIPPTSQTAYITMNTLATCDFIQLKTPEALNCFVCFVTGLGGNKLGIEGCYGNRKYVDLFSMKENIVGKAFVNSINEYNKENMQTSIKAAKSVLNEYNTEIYIAMSPSAEWDGCKYLTNYSSEEVFEAIINTNAMGTFNRASAAITLHGVYNPTEDRYTFEYWYYLTDYYNFDFAPVFEEQNMIGIAKSYELYGKLLGRLTIEGGDKNFTEFPNIFEMLLVGEEDHEEKN